MRVNTNGQGSLICGRNIAPEFEGIVDTVSISLNTPNAEEYAAIVRSQFGDKAFPAMLDFARAFLGIDTGNGREPGFLHGPFKYLRMAQDDGERVANIVCDAGS